MPVYNWGSEVPLGEPMGWTIDGQYRKGREYVVPRSADYVPFQSIFQPDGRHAYHPDELQYPRTADFQERMGLRVLGSKERREQWQEIRPSHDRFPRRGIFDLSVRNPVADEQQFREARYGDLAPLGLQYLQGRERDEFRDIFEEMMDREEDRRGARNQAGGGFMQGGLRTAVGGLGPYGEGLDDGAGLGGGLGGYMGGGRGLIDDVPHGYDDFGRYLQDRYAFAENLPGEYEGRGDMFPGQYGGFGGYNAGGYGGIEDLFPEQYGGFGGYNAGGYGGIEDLFPEQCGGFGGYNAGGYGGIEDLFPEQYGGFGGYGDYLPRSRGP